MAHWDYTSQRGPRGNHWFVVAPAASGSRQSPIDIKPKETKFELALQTNGLKCIYNGGKAKQLLNNGHSVQMTYDTEGSSLTGGPLNYRYKLVQFHFHWGRNSSTGSEHTVDGQTYAAELHLVHMNTDRYDDFGAAAQAEDGLAVLGIFLKPGADHEGMQKLTDMLSKVVYKDDTIDVHGGFDPTLLLPKDITKFWTYPGSLTTPPCYESVTWIVFQEPIEVSESQLEKFRALREHKQGESLHNEFHGHIIENYRPPLGQGNRVVRSSCEL